MTTPEIRPLPTGRVAEWRKRGVEAVRKCLERVRDRVSPIQLASDAFTPSADDPPFEISSADTCFEELEAIAFHPEVARQVAGPARPPLDEQSPPEARIPTGAEQLGAPRRSRPAPVIDVTFFSTELDLLEMRILELRDLVDRFVVVEAPRAYGGFRKPMFLKEHWRRFERFGAHLTRVEVPETAIAVAYPDGRRVVGDTRGEDAGRAASWREVRKQIEFPDDVVIVFSDIDEFPSRGFVRWIKEYEVRLPMRVALPALRYCAGWFDRDTRTDLVIFSRNELGWVDAHPEQLRALPGPVFVVAGSAHYTSFVSPLVLRAKFAMTADWDAGIVPFLRNDAGQTAAMMAQGRWFGRALDRYDPDTDPKALVPWAARAYRSRYPFFWG
jgi:hypothetical protein